MVIGTVEGPPKLRPASTEPGRGWIGGGQLRPGRRVPRRVDVSKRWGPLELVALHFEGRRLFKSSSPSSFFGCSWTVVLLRNQTCGLPGFKDATVCFRFADASKPGNQIGESGIPGVSPPFEGA